MSDSRTTDRSAWLTGLVVVTALSLLGFTAWCVLLVVDVSELRGSVATRVQWLQQLHEIQTDDQPDELRARAEADTELDFVTEAIAADPTVEPALRSAAEDTRRSEDEPADRASRLVPLIRVETAALSVELGDRWNQIYWLAGIALVLAASTLGLLVYVRFVLLRRARQTLTSLELHLRDADRLAAVGTLAAGVAHELNNPLTYVLANLEMLQSNLPTSDEPHELASEALRGTERVLGIVRDLRTLARPTRDHVSACDVEACLDAALSVARTDLRRVAELRRDYAGVPQVLGSQTRLGQLFLNLVVNAVHAMRQHDGRDHELHVTTRTHGTDMVEIEIRDTGPGIPPEIANRVFEPFVTTKPLGEGTGLGLFVCHNIIESLDGELVLSSTGDGTVATIRLPAAVVPAADHGAGSAA